MGLAIEVGYLADLALEDPDSADEFRTQLSSLNRALAHEGLGPHAEPEAMASADRFSCSMWGYSGLHYLRRIAAWNALNRALPEPGDANASSDPIIEQYNARALGGGWFPYRHLMLHSDCEGYYVPQDFANVIFPDEKREIAGCMIGSSQQLLTECTKLAEILGLPLDVGPESDEVLEAAQNQGQGGTGWRRYGVESYSCLQLFNACKASVKSKALVVFC